MSPSTRQSRRAVRLAFAAAVAAACAWTSHARAQDAAVAFTGATVHTAAGPAIPNGTVVVQGGRIVAAGAGVPIPAGARVVPAAGKHIWPGVIAPLSALGLTEIGAVRATNDWAEIGQVNPNIKAEVAINPDSDLIPVARAGGITTALVVAGGGAISGTSALVHLAGWTYEDMTVRSPVALHVRWPNMGINRGFNETRSEAEQRRDRERAIAEIRNAFGDARAYAKARAAQGKAGVPRHDHDAKWDGMARAIAGDIPVVFHAATLAQIQAVLRFVDEQGLGNVVLAGGYDAGRVADELKRRDIAVITGGTLELPRRSYEPYDFGMSLPARLHQAGVRFCISDGGATGEASNARNLPHHAAMAAAFGLPREEALKAITLYPARILGAGDRLGSLEPGKTADLVIGDGDPLEMTTQVEQVWIAGREVSLENRQSRLFHKYDARPRGSLARKR